MDSRKGIILAGGSGTRLYPLTQVISKQLLPIYDKPMIYYPLTVLMTAGIREILIITTPHDQAQYMDLLSDGSQWGLSLHYKVQPSPDGLAQAFILAEDFLNGSPSALILGDNIFFGSGLASDLKAASSKTTGATIFGYHVADPERYGVLSFKANGEVGAIIEKPEIPPSNYAVTGLYFVDGSAPERAKAVLPSKRGELEIVSVLESYLTDKILHVRKLDRGYTWLDTGTHAALMDASNFVRTMVERQGLQIGSPEEIAFYRNWISERELINLAGKLQKNQYGQYLKAIVSNKTW